MDASTDKGRSQADPVIHPTAIVEPGARLGRAVTVGPYCIVGSGAELEDGVTLRSHVVVEGRTRIGAGTEVWPFTTLGTAPQHLRYEGEDTRLIIGPNCVIREQVSIHKGTEIGGGETVIGAHTMVMAASHIAHDCKIGEHVIVASNCTLGGHVTVGDHVFLGGLAGVHQFCRIGAYAFVGGAAAVNIDVIPFGSAVGNRAKLGGLNLVGMKRAGFSRATINEIRSAYRDLFNDDALSFKDRVAKVAECYGHCPEVMMIVDFIRADADRPVLGAR
ncbi:acyl-ACP--UDP-N-acetylglucosamine O-acyltransferase [Meinhardsimonia xiamenensis]|jgi:UDP-N-acetylglucosamine acyltransferase|uniref:acyl-ACP--UDP-N-acetylglucosamine O-acyltransferase n=1 Tax=Meinhardsimonia xiamenensis TaxID=990712 RepID=UPI000B85B3A9|nr:acyl-ACP--UDP-N-acetylglucosamine O-acyltransferase [Meinhardsimonia xiamenensis]